MANIHHSRKSLPRSSKPESELAAEGFVSIRTLIRLTGMARSQLVYLEREGVIRPVLIGIGSTLLFKKADALLAIDEFRKLRPGGGKIPRAARAQPELLKGGSNAGYSGEQASEVFRAMSEGLDEIGVVAQLRMHPRVVALAAAEFRRMREEIVITRDRLKLINELKLDGNFPITNADELLDLLRSCEHESVCAECSKRPKRICDPCSLKVAKRYAQTAD